MSDQKIIVVSHGTNDIAGTPAPPDARPLEESWPAYGLCEAFLRIYPNAQNGPAHIVLADQNLEDGNIDFCLDLFQIGDFPSIPGDERAATVRFLQMLRAIPEDLRLDGEPPEDEYI